MKSTSVKTLGMLFLCLFLGACITETSNPVFNVERSDDEALENYLLLAVGYLDEDDLVSAKRHLSNAADIDPNNSDIFAIWGLVYSREGEMDLADENFRRALRINPGDSQARNNYAAFLFAQGQFENAFEELEQVVRDTEYPQRAQAFENMGIAALQLNLINEAEQAFTRAMQLNSNQLRSALELTSINISRNNIPQARAFWQNYLTLIQFYNLGHNPRSLLIGVQVELAMQNSDRAGQYGEMLRTSFPGSPEYQTYRQLTGN